MEKTDLKDLLEDFAKGEDASAQIDTLLRTRKKVLAFPDSQSLEAFYQPVFALAELVRHLIDHQKRIEALEGQNQELEKRNQELSAKLSALLDEREALAINNQAMITCIRALDQGITHLNTHKFKYSVYDLLEKINAIIKPDDRASFEIEGSGIFESVKFSAARTAEPHMTITRLLDAGKDKIPTLFSGDSEREATLRQLLEELRTIEGKNSERTAQAQKFGLRLKVVNRDERKERVAAPPSPPSPQVPAKTPPPASTRAGVRDISRKPPAPPRGTKPRF